MIITCEKCSTSFNLDDALIKPDGSKLRCSLCKHTFTAYPAQPEQPSLQAPVSFPGEEPEDTASDELFETDNEMDDFSIHEDELTLESDDFESDGLELEDSGLEIDDSTLEMEDSGLEIEDDSPEPVDSAPADEGIEFGMEDDFSFESDDFQSQEDNGVHGFELDESDDEIQELRMEESDDEVHGLELDDSELEIEDDGPESMASDLEMEITPLEMEDDPTADEGIEFELEEDPAQSDEAGDPGVFDGIEFEPLEDDGLEPETDFSESDESDAGLTLDSEPDEGEAEEEFELEFDIEDEADQADGEPVPEFEPVSEIEDTEQAEAADEPPELVPEDDFAEYDEVLEQEAEPEPDYEEEEPVEPGDIQEQDTTLSEAQQPPGIRRKKKKKPLIGAPVLILLLLFFLVAGAWLASLMTGYNIPYLSDIKVPYLEKIFKKPPAKVSEEKPVPNQQSVNGRFVTNTTAGTLFVITGKVENPSKNTYKHIRVKGSLLTKGNVEAKTKIVFCGNIITEEMLKTGNIADIEKILTIKEGNHNTNEKIKPGTSIPFMVVFSNLPEKLQNFVVKVESFEKS